MSTFSYAQPNLPMPALMAMAILTPMSIGVRIYRAREKAGLTQADVAKELGVTREAVSQWEREVGGKIPRAGRLTALAALLKTTPEELYFGSAISTDSTEAAMLKLDDEAIRFLHEWRALPREHQEAFIDRVHQLYEAIQHAFGQQQDKPPGLIKRFKNN
jgi:transcriptional regulator with XRE-family HTH domain